MSRKENIEREGQKKSPVAIVSEEDPKVKALSSGIRRAIISLLFVKGSLYNSQIAKEIGIKSSHLAYHLHVLNSADYVKKVLEQKRDGKQFARYSVTKDGEDFLDFIDAKSKLELLKPSSKKLIRHKTDKENPRVILYNVGENTADTNRLKEVLTSGDVHVTWSDFQNFLTPSDMLKLGQEMRSIDMAIMMTPNDSLKTNLKNEIVGTLMGYAAASNKTLLWMMPDSKSDSSNDREYLKQLHKEYDKLIIYYYNSIILETTLKKVVTLLEK